MSIQLNYRGIVLTASSVDEAVSLADKLADRQARPAPAPAPPRERWPIQAAAKVQQQFLVEPADPKIETAVLFLETIQAAGDDGAGAADFQRALKIDHPKGVGNRAGIVNEAIRAAGLEVESVYSKTRTASGRTWIGGPKLPQALDLLKKQIKKG